MLLTSSLVSIIAQAIYSLYLICYDQIQELNKVITARDARIEELEKIVDNSATENEAIGKLRTHCPQQMQPSWRREAC